MAAASDIFDKCFPSIDSEVSHYIQGILDGGSEEFDTADDLFDAIGHMLLESDNTKSEDDIKEICDRLYHVLKGDEDRSEGDGPVKILGAPVHLGKLAEDMEDEHKTQGSIWLTKRSDSTTTVNQKRLEKAEAKLKQKQEKRSQEVPVKAKVETIAASASQQSSKKDTKLESSGANRTKDVSIENFDIAFGDKVLLKNANLMLAFGRRYGLVGRNGIGKTTLLRMIATGELRIPSHISILHVEQEVVGDDTPAIESVLSCDTKRERLLQEEKEITSKAASTSPTVGEGSTTSRLAEIYHELEAMEADKAPARAGLILAGLGFSTEGQTRPTKEYSGGWRMRLALAQALFSKPDLLLLDEPTNMLDMKAILWLEKYLQTWQTTILCVSHDRQFLNSITTDILHLQSQQLDHYKGDYEVFVRTRTDRLKNQQKEYEAQLQYRQHIQIFIDRFRYNANRASQVQSKLKLLEKLPELKPIEKDSVVVLKFHDAEKLSPPILQLDEVTFYYANSKDNVIFKNVCVNANADSRICIVGENGAGKTTLLKILLGELEPVTGIRHGHRSLRIGYFCQHHIDQMDLNLNSVEVLQRRYPGKAADFYRSKLGSFGVSGDMALQPVASLSGGQKSRVAFAQMTLNNPNFFILDEPTNHLDMETIEALGHALDKFEGGVILVSHDERLIRMICKELWVCGNKCVTALEGGIDEYKKIVEKELQVSL